MLLLFFAAGVVASLVHVIAHPQSTFPATGASGAIAGLVTYYALRFPQARLTRWGLVAALLLQLLAIWLRQRGLLFPSAWAHLGGAATGIVFSYLGKFRTFR